MKKIGISIPWDYLSGNHKTVEAVVLYNTFGKSDLFLGYLENHGISCIELRNRQVDMKSEDMDIVLKQLSKYNFSITFHGDLPVCRNIINPNLFFPWIKTYSDLFLCRTTVTLHTFNGYDNTEIYKYRTINFIKQLNDLILDRDYPVNLALENQRSKGLNDPGLSLTDLVDIVKSIDSSILGICWDMGHSYANLLTDKNLYPRLADNSFVEKIIHTHIHDLGPDGRTHWFFKENKVPIKEYITLLNETGYNGIYNLELSFDRFSDEKNISKMVQNTILMLRNIV